MRVAQVVLVFVSVCTGLNHDQRLCSEDALIPFTGFKVHIQYTWELFFPSITKQLRFTHCRHGKVVSTAAVPVINGTDIWSETFCFVKEATPLQPTASGSTIRILYLLRHKVVVTTSGHYFQLAQNKLESPNIETEAGFSSMDHVQCYKMSRRKKYAKTGVDAFVPHSFVGGLFFCGFDPIEQNSTDFEPSEIVKPPEISCLDAISPPISALVADKTTRQWLHFRKGILGSKFVQSIPFLKSPLMLDPRFSTSDPRGSWSTDLRLNEDYLYSPLDLLTLTSLSQKTAKLIQSMSEAPSLRAISSLFEGQDDKRLFNTYKGLHDQHKFLIGGKQHASSLQRLYKILSEHNVH